VQHYLLLDKVARRVQDAKVMHLLKLLLKATGEKGVPQGGVITPRTQKITSNLSVRWGTDGDALLPLDLCHIRLYSDVVCHAPAQPRRHNV
jgi:hypothetical protein